MALVGPFPLSQVTLRVVVNAPGVYVLSRDGRTAAYVGRSDGDVRNRLLQSSGQGRYTYFWFDYATSPMQAYKSECELYHTYNPPDNVVHPAVPSGMNWRCPILGCQWG